MRTDKPHATYYHGQRIEYNQEVWCTAEGGAMRELNWRNDLRNHSPCGPNWGYGGSGPAQLALAILADALGSDEYALRFYQQYKHEVISAIKTDTFIIAAASVVSWVQGKLAETGETLPGAN